MLKGLLPYVDDLNKQDKNGQTAAHICALHGELECLKVLAANSANLFLVDKNGMLLSHLAAQFNHSKIIEFLFQMGITLKIASVEGKLPIHYAAQFGSFESLKLLSEYYVDISQVDNDGNYAAHLASINDKLKCLKYLVKIGTPINASVNKKGRTFAHVCAFHNSVGSLHWLLENGADTGLRDCKFIFYCFFSFFNYFFLFKDDGNTMTHLACLGGSANTMNCCLQHDLSLAVLNKKGETPIDVARTVGKSLHIQKASMLIL
jgi:ankyrin repeat protein